MPEFVFKIVFKKENCPESGDDIKDCPLCVVHDFSELPCVQTSNEKIIILNPTMKIPGRVAPDEDLCKKQDFAACLKCLRKYFKTKPCVLIRVRRKQEYKRWIGTKNRDTVFITEQIKENNLKIITYANPFIDSISFLHCKATPENMKRFDKRLEKKGFTVKRRCPL